MKEQKVVLVTGASSGIGKVTAMHLINQGHIVYGAARRVEKMQDLIDAGGHAVAMDVTKEEMVKEAVDKVVSEQGKIDALINNAGYGQYGAVEFTDLDKARYQFEVNIFGLAAVTKAVIPHMKKQKSGTILNISSIGGKIYTPMGAWYHATKHALEGWSDCLRLELTQFGINVVIVEPGAITTDFANVLTDNMDEQTPVSEDYKWIVDGMMKSTEEHYTEVKPSTDPMIIAKIIEKAITTKKPKTRYKGGLFSSMTFVRWLVSDRIFDKMIMSQFT